MSDLTPIPEAGHCLARSRKSPEQRRSHEVGDVAAPALARGFSGKATGGISISGQRSARMIGAGLSGRTGGQARADVAEAGKRGA